MPLPERNEDRAQRILLLCARAREYESLLEEGDWSRKLHQNHPLHRRTSANTQVRVTHTGVGPGQTKRTLSRIAGALQPDLVIPTGTAGALNDSLNTGEIFLPTAVVDRDSEGWIYPEQRFLRWVLGELEEIEPERGEDAPRFRTGPLLTSSNPVLEGEERSRLEERYQAMAVDMETYHQVVHLRDLLPDDSFTWIGIRAISDSSSLEDPDRAESVQAPAARRIGDLLADLVARMA